VIERVSIVGLRRLAGRQRSSSVRTVYQPGSALLQSMYGVPIRELGPLDLLEGKCRGLITRAAGTGAPGNTGDDGPAADGQLNEPVEVAVTTEPLT
jgi:hypothetical protein